ncbi:MAG: FG-GAP-like repeat-containing protein [Crocinitomicaceae bacterium]|nr:FG-GAP-like repeat-containing protein [Crocinitomicaceae bacterium]
MKTLYLLIILCLLSICTNAQTLDFKFTQSSEVLVCEDSTDFFVTIENTGLQDLQNVTISISLPTGIEYIPGSVNDMNSSGVTEQNVLNSTNLIFTANEIGNGDSVLFSIKYFATIDAISFQEQGGFFRNNVTVNSTQLIENQLSEFYNVLFPVLSIISVAPNSVSFSSGASVQRSITVINGGNGRTNEIVITDVQNNAALEITSIDIGSLFGDSIILNGTDFNSIGNGDNYLDQNESITIVETLSGIACSDLSIVSTINASWGCENQTENSSNSYANSLIEFDSPNITLDAEADLSECFGNGSASKQKLILVNTGAGLGKDLQIEIFKASGSSYDQDIFSRFDENSFTYKDGVNGQVNSLSITSAIATSNSGDLSCLGNNPIGKVIIDLPDLNPGDSLIIEWDMYSCCIQTCEDDALKGWRAELLYTDVCDIEVYDNAIKGQEVNSQYITFFTETPIDITENESENYRFIVSSFQNTLPQTSNSLYRVRFTLEDGLEFENLSFASNGIEWLANSISYDAQTNIVEAIYPASAPFVVAKSVLELRLLGSCGVNGWKDIELNFDYIVDETCSSCSIPLECTVLTTTYLHCPDANCNSLKNIEFDISRINFGSPDNDLDGSPDVSGSLNNDQVMAHRAMTGDTILSRSTGVIGLTTETWGYSKFISDIDYGNVLDCIEANLTIYDVETQQSYTVQGITPVITGQGNTRIFEYNLSEEYLSSLNVNLDGFTYGAGDSIDLQVKYRVSDIVPSGIKETTFLNEFYVSEVDNPTSAQKENCGFRNGRITLIGYSFKNKSANNFTVNSCTKIINQGFGMSIGDVGSNYSGGNLFPYEYRNWGKVKEIIAVIPPNYAHINTRYKNYNTKKTNAANATTLNSLSPDNIIGDTLIYDIEQYYNSGQLALSDDGFDSKLFIEIAPNCDVPENTYQDVDWFVKYVKSDAIDGLETDLIASSSPDKIRFKRADIQLLSQNPWQDANQRNVVWDYRVKNNSSSGVDNAWVHIVEPANIVVDSILIDNTGEALTLQNDIYLLGSINANSTANLSVYGRFTNCDSVIIDTYVGYECTAYPVDFSSFQCDFEYMPLYVEPKQSGFQTRISSSVGADPCDSDIEVIVDVTSTKIAHMYDMEIRAVTSDTNKIAIVENMSEFQYNISNSYQAISNPSYTNGSYFFDINEYNSDFSNDGIPGVLDISNNRYRLKYDLTLGDAFTNGDYIEFEIQGKNACAVTLPVISLAYDPSVSFSEDNLAGLNLDNETNWSASWGDYDNDGYDDLFVPSRNYNVKNLLYHNNTDGTFTKVTTGPIVNDLGSSISGAWGDYNNDGYLDLFVTNSENSPNRLYTNNQDGTFSSVDSGAIIEEGVYSNSAAWADYNRDGYLDIVITDFHPTDFNRLLYGTANGEFILDETSLISLSATSAVGAAWGDYDNDGDPDLFIANTNNENNQLFRNDEGLFVEILSGQIVNDSGTSVGGVWGDYDNDGDLDIYVTNSSDQEPNFFYINNGDGTFTRDLNIEIVDELTNSHGASWIDFDNDGNLDLLVANDQSKKNLLYSNNGDLSFLKLTNAISENETNSYGVAWSDYDNDGDYDLFVANTEGEANSFFINDKGACTNFISVDLFGCNSNKKGIGTIVKVKSTIDGESVWQTKHVSTQTSSMGGQNSIKLVFGLSTAESIDSLVILWPSGMKTIMVNPAINQLVSINEDCGSKVCGNVFYDMNNNGIRDNNEVGIPNKRILISPGDITATTDIDGNYEVYLSDGSYTISQAPDTNWTQLSPLLDYDITVLQSTSSIYCGNDFGNDPVCNYPDLELTIGATAFRRGLRNDLNVSVSNLGAFETVDDITIQLSITDNVFILDDDWVLESSSNGINNYTFSFDNLSGLSDTLFRLVDSVSQQSNLDETIQLTANISYPSDECNASNNSFSLTDVVVGSIDPNDKLVNINGRGSSEYAHKEERLIYKIRFQNVGNYSAQRVFIIDTLSNNLDLNSLRVEASSHSFSFSQQGNVISWVNNMIELPDSTSNPEGSQGFVSFSILPKKACEAFTLIENNAGIQFDYNEYVITNTVETVIIPKGQLPTGKVVYVYPNPASDIVHVSLLNENKRTIPIKSIVILNNQGVLVDRKTPNVSNEYPVYDIDNGMYQILVEDYFGVITSAKFVKN